MFAAYTELKNAQKVKRYVQKKDLIDNNYLVVRELGKIYFPLKNQSKNDFIKKLKIPEAEVVEVKFSFPKKPVPLKIEDILKGKLSVGELELIPRSQEIVGKIMILEVPEELESKEKDIAEAYLKLNSNIETIVKKEAIHTGVFRLRRVKILAGKRSKETIHYENGIRLRLHLEKTYFSARSGNERLRVANLVKKGEEVLVMFSGSAPYPLVIAKNSEASIIYGIEINPMAHIYAVDSLALNNLDEKIKLYNGDVREVLPKIDKKFDRIAMPLPKTGEEFLDTALEYCKIGGIIHLYSFIDETLIDDDAKRIKKLCLELGHNVKILKKVKCGQFSPKVFRVCFDIKLLD